MKVWVYDGDDIEAGVEMDGGSDVGMINLSGKVSNCLKQAYYEPDYPSHSPRILRTVCFLPWSRSQESKSHHLN